MSDIAVGTQIPEFVVESVSAEKMKTMAFVLRDPNPIHWNAQAVVALGLGDSPINQGPTNEAYVINALLAWLGDPGRLLSITVRFRSNVYAGERVVAGGEVTGIGDEGGRRIAECTVWLRKEDGSDAIAGTATVAL